MIFKKMMKVYVFLFFVLVVVLVISGCGKMVS